MNLKAWACLLCALAVFGWASGASGSGTIELGGGLLLRPDGVVVAAWELPGCELAADAFDAPDAEIGIPPGPRDAWQARLHRDW